MKIRLPNGKVLFLRINCTIVNPAEAVIGLDSGKAFTGSHYLFFDFDRMPGLEAIAKMKRIVFEEKLRRGIVIESSKGKYWGISFSPTKYERAVKIAQESGEDVNHTKHFIQKGQCTIRMSLKKTYKPRITKVIENSLGTNFYNWKLEEVFLNRFKLLGYEVEYE